MSAVVDWIKAHPYKTAGIFVVVAAVVCLFLYLGGVFGGDNKLSTSSGSSKSGTLSMEASSLGSSNARRAARSKKTEFAVKDCPAPTADQLLTCNVTAATGQVICSPEGEDIYIDDEDSEGNHYAFQTDCFIDNRWYGIFAPRSSSAIVVTLENVSGEFYGMYVTTEDDTFKAGFKPSGDDFNSGAEVKLSEMVVKLANAHTLVGATPGDPITSTLTTYEFNATQPVAHQIELEDYSVLPSSVDTDVSVAGNTAGSLRFAVMYVTYTYTLAGQQMNLRLYINHPTIPMATKSIYDPSTGTYRFVDVTDPNAPTLVDDPSEATTLLTFWDQPHSPNGDDIPSDLEEDELEEITNQIAQEAAASEAYKSYFSTYVIPMPISMTNTTAVNFQEAETKSMSVDLVVDGSVSFRDAKESMWGGQTWSEQQLVDNLAVQAMLFEINNLAFRSKVTFV